MLLALPLGLCIGLVIGTVGGGGAILALPLLVYVLGEGVAQATTASLVVVAIAATAGAAALARDRQVCWRLAGDFAAAAALGALLGSLGNRAVSGPLLLLAFVPVMLVAARAMWRRAAAAPAGTATGGCPAVPLPRLLAAGVATGVLTGFFGVGGGFVIVPVLTIWLGVGARRAVASSLAIIALTAASAFAAHLVAGGSLDLPVTAALGSAAAVGAVAGARAGRRLPAAALARGFALVVVAVALLLAVDVVALGGPPSA